MIQDIYPHHLFNQYEKDAAPMPGDSVMAFPEGKLLVKRLADGRCTFPTVEEMGMEHPYIYLLKLDDQRFFLLWDMPGCPASFETISIRDLRAQQSMEKAQIYAAITGKHLWDWYRDTQFCGRCGKLMHHSDRERAMACTCGNTVYPRIMPAVIVGVTNGDQLLLTQYRVGVGHNALIAGFTEIGETAEETVAREVMEEAGLRVKNIRYYKTQPWGIANDLLLGYYCDVDGDTRIHMDTQELKVAHWVNREDIVLQPDDFSLTNEMMMMFKTGRQ